MKNKDKISIEELLQELPKKYPEEMQNISDIDESVFAKIEENAYNQAYSSPSKGRNYFFKAMIAVGAVASIIILFTVTLFVFDTPEVKAYIKNRKEIIFFDESTLGDLEDDPGSPILQDQFIYIEEITGTRAIRPHWIPYTFDDIGSKMSEPINGERVIEYKFFSTERQGEIVIILEHVSIADPINKLEFFDMESSGDKKLYFKKDIIYDDFVFVAKYIYDDQYLVTVHGPISKEKIIKIIDSIR